MPIIVQINSFDSGSTGNIAKQINQQAEKHGFTTYFLFGRFWKKERNLLSNEMRVGNPISNFFHLLMGRLFDKVGIGSFYSTKKTISILKKLNPDIIHLHNIHGYYLNYPLLFNYLKSTKISVVWTLHDCWAMTGHCAYFDAYGCERWRAVCYDCPQKKEYPKSIFWDSSKSNYKLKKKYFTSLGNKLTLVPVSYWLEGVLRKSFFKDTLICTIHNGIDLSVFKQKDELCAVFRLKYQIENKFMAVACASPWTQRKGLSEYIELSKMLEDNFVLVLVGLSEEQISTLPDNIIGLPKTNNIEELIEIYSTADVVLNLSYEETLGMTSIEGLACGTPSIVYNCTASPEIIGDKTGYVVQKGDLEGVKQKMKEILRNGKNYYSPSCRERVEKIFNQSTQYKEYIHLYRSILD